jgi:hypothetical protein
MLSEVSESAEAIASMALYDGAGIVADAVSAAVDGIRAKPNEFYAVDGAFERLPSQAEKDLLKQGAAGIAEFRKDALGVETSVGFNNSGYGEVNGRTKPIPQIANAINSGTSFMKKQPFFRRAINSSKAAAQAAIEAKGKALFDEIGNKYN